MAEGVTERLDEGDWYHHTLQEVFQLKEEEWFSRGVALSPECNKHIVDSSLPSGNRQHAAEKSSDVNTDRNIGAAVTNRLDGRSFHIS